MKFESSEIKLSTKKLLGLLTLEYGLIWILVGIGVSILIWLCALFFDYRFAILGLIWIFIVIPLLMLFLFFIYGMLPVTAYNTLSHKLIFDEEDIRIIFLNKEEEEENKIREETVPYKNIRKIKYGGDYIIAITEDPYKGILFIPASSFEKKDQFVFITNMLHQASKDNKKSIHESAER